MQKPYDGPYRVITKKDKWFEIEVKGKKTGVSIDRLKPAFGATDITDNENNAVSQQPTKHDEKTEEPHKPTPATTTRGRKIRLPVRFQDYRYHWWGSVWR